MSENDKYYTSERHIQILISLLKEHGVKKIVASPGTTNLTFVASVQHDSFFEIFSSVDERSAAYLACGLALESGEPVVLSCTGATASRNYIPGLTEAYYSKLPVLAVTSTQHIGRVGHHIAQVIDRSTQLNDIVYMSKHIGVIHTDEDEWDVTTSINEALLELRHRGGGPVHLNVETTYSRDYSTKDLPPVPVIRRIGYGDELPPVPGGRIAIFVGSHSKWTPRLTRAVDEFCSRYNAVVLCDQTSNYSGKYKVNHTLVFAQAQYRSPCKNINLLIHIGNISNSTFSLKGSDHCTVWRVNPDGKPRDTFKRLNYVFEMEETFFFEQYSALKNEAVECAYYSEFIEECNRINSKIPMLPFSNVWIAQQTIEKLPEDSTAYFAILNTLRSWNLFPSRKGILGMSNTGGFGIDGGLSSLIGASLANQQKLFFCFIGDLGFFYDMNVLGNRHVGSNIRVMVINNGHGTEFTNYNHPGAAFGEEAEPYIAAAGHFGNKSPILLKHYAEDLGFEYMSASTKNEYLENIDRFTSARLSDKSIVFEVFTSGEDESNAIKSMYNIEVSASSTVKKAIKGIIGGTNYSKIKKTIKH